MDIFNSLSLPDLEKIVFNLHDANERSPPLTQISAKFQPFFSAKWHLKATTSSARL